MPTFTGTNLDSAPASRSSIACAEVPLLYEGRDAEQQVDRKAIDR